MREKENSQSGRVWRGKAGWERRYALRQTIRSCWAEFRDRFTGQD